MIDATANHSGSDAILEGVGGVLFDSSLDGLLVVDSEAGRVLKANASVERLLGYAPGALVGESYRVLFPEETDHGAGDAADEVQSHDVVLRQTFRRADGARIRLDLTAVMLCAGGRDCILVTLRDVSEREAHEQRIADAARTDALTGLCSRRELLHRLGNELQRGRRYEVPCSVCFVDVDRYKSVNDAFGHAVGDSVLKAIAHIVTAELRTTDFAGRYGGDEIVVVLPHTDLSTARGVVERIRQRVAAAPLRAGSNVVAVTASFGISRTRADDTGIDDVLGRADAALYEAKAAGRNRTCVDDSDESENLAGTQAGVGG